jgi:phosphate transport system substrate-binding protein
MLNVLKRVALATTAAGLMAGATVARAAELIKIDGSSTVYPITEAVAEEFGSEMKGQVRVTVGISGTGGGFQEVRPRRDRHPGRVPPHPGQGDG